MTTIGIAAILSRMAIAAALVAATSLMAERAGPFLGAMIATLPLSAGPAYVFLALDHGPAFVTASALASLLGTCGTTAYVVAYAAVAARRGTALSLLAALAAWAAAILLLNLRTWSTAEAFAASLGTSLLGIAATARIRREARPIRSAARPWHLAVRAVAVMGLVAGVMGAAQLAGPEAAGFVALVPIIFTSLILILQPLAGGPAVSGMLAHGLVGMIGYAPAFATLRLAAEPLGPLPALGLALAICLGWNALLIGLRGLRRP